MGRGRTVSVKFDGKGVARHMRKSSAKLRVGFAVVRREFASSGAAAARDRASSLGGVHKHVAPGIDAIGDTVNLNAGAQPAILGAEFGGGARPRTRQFPPYRQEGYMLLPSLRVEERKLNTIMTNLIDQAL